MRVVSVAKRDGHGLGKTCCEAIELVAGEGVIGDAHRGVTVKHRSRVAKDPMQPNLRQVHLVHAELLAEVADKGFAVHPGELGENILTADINLLGLPVGARLCFPSGAEIEVTGLRNPCVQLEGHSKGLLAVLLDRAADRSLIRKGGVMAIVAVGGVVRRGDPINLISPDVARPLQPV